MRTQILSALLSTFAISATAQEVVVVAPCVDPLTPVTAQDMGRYLEGTWQMSARGTGFTTGTNMMAVTLRFDDATNSLRMEGGGQSVPLVPMGLARNLGEDPAPDPDFDASVEQLTPDGLTATDLDVLNGCPSPMRYWWTLQAGGQTSYGALMFVERGLATGFMANSAGGSRSVLLTR